MLASRPESGSEPRVLALRPGSGVGAPGVRELRPESVLERRVLAPHREPRRTREQSRSALNAEAARSSRPRFAVARQNKRGAKKLDTIPVNEMGELAVTKEASDDANHDSDNENGCSLLAVGLLADGVFNGGMLTKDAQAIIGRPLTPDELRRRCPPDDAAGDPPNGDLRCHLAGGLHHGCYGGGDSASVRGDLLSAFRHSVCGRASRLKDGGALISNETGTQDALAGLA